MLRQDTKDIAVVGIDHAVTAIVAQGRQSGSTQDIGYGTGRLAISCKAAGPGRDRYAARLRRLAEGLFTGTWETETEALDGLHSRMLPLWCFKPHDYRCSQGKLERARGPLLREWHMFLNASSAQVEFIHTPPYQTPCSCAPGA